MKIVYVDMVNFQSGIDSLTEEQRQKFKDDLKESKTCLRQTK